MTPPVLPSHDVVRQLSTLLRTGFIHLSNELRHLENHALDANSAERARNAKNIAIYLADIPEAVLTPGNGPGHQDLVLASNELRSLARIGACPAMHKLIDELLQAHELESGRVQLSEEGEEPFQRRESECLKYRVPPKQTQR